MNGVVWKFPVDVHRGTFVIACPAGAEVAHLGLDPATEEACVWMIVDPDAKREHVRFHARDTGQPLAIADGGVLARLRFVGTVTTYLRHLQLHSIRHVWREV